MIKKFFIDVGHGGSTGAYYDNIHEDDLNLGIALQFRRILLEYSDMITNDPNRDYTQFEFVIDILTDKKMDYMKERVDFANKYGAEALVSIHANASPSNVNAKGFNIFYFDGSPRSKILAYCLEARLKMSNKVPFMQAVHTDKDTAIGGIGVLRFTKMPAALVEMGFMTNEPDLIKMQDSQFQLDVARAIFYGTTDFLSIK